MITCRCAMCGEKNAGHISRNSYWRAGIVHSENRPRGSLKSLERQLRRTRENRTWKMEAIIKEG